MKFPRNLWTGERVAEGFRTAFLLAVVGASVALFLQEAIGRKVWVDAFIARNELSLPDRHKILLSMVGAAVGFVAIAAGYIAWKRNELAYQRVRTTALVLSPLSLLGPILPLFRLRTWENDPLLLGCAIAIVVLLLEKTAALSLSATPGEIADWLFRRWRGAATWSSQLSRFLPIALVSCGAVAYAIFASVLTIRYHQRLGTSAFDLGGYDNIFYNALRGRPLRGTVAVPSGENWSSLRTHAEFSTYAFLPFYALRPRPETLLCIQAAMVGLGAVPVYLLAERRVGRPIGFLLGFAYLLFAPIHSGNFYDFHFQPLASTLILWSFYFLDTKKDVAFCILFVIALGCREDVSMSYAVAGGLLLTAGYRPMAGLAIGLISGVYFLVVRFVVMPHFGTWWFNDMYKDLLPSGDNSLFGVVKTIISNPLFALGTILTKEKFLHVLKIMLPLAFLPARRAGLWLGFVPAMLGTIITTGYHPTTDTTFQYVFYWVPFVFVGTVIVLQDIRAKHGWSRQAAAVVAMTFATLATSYHWGAVFQRDTFAAAWGHIDLEPLTEAEHETLRNLRALGDMIPPQASLALSEREAPQFSTRLDVYALRVGVNDAQYILYATDSGELGAKQATEALSSGKYERMADRGRFVLLKRK